MIKEEVLGILNVFDQSGISEENQRRLLQEGIYFDFTYGEPDFYNRNKRMNVFEFADFLRACQQLDINVDANELVSKPSDASNEKIVETVTNVMKLQKKKDHKC